jgi:O-antigen/teichoic acid export membrane protein
MLANALPQLYALVLSVVAARYLGPSGMGRQSFIAFVEATTITLLSGSFSLALMRYIGEAVGAGRAGSARWLAVRILRIEMAAALVGGGALVVIAALGGEPRDAWLLAALAVVSSTVATVPGAVLVGLQRWRDATIAGLTTGGLGVVATIVVLSLGGRITAMFVVEAIVTTIALLWTGALARGALDGLHAQPAPAPDLLRGTVRFAVFSFGGSILYLIVWRRSEFFFLQHYSSDRQIAFYSIAFAVATGVVRLPSAMGEVLAPAVATLFGAGAHERIRAGFSRALRLLVLATLPVTAAAAALGPEALRLFWGEAFSPATGPFLIMVAASLLTPVTVLCSSLLAGLGRVGVPLLAEALAAGVDIGVAFALVPHHGALGAAIASSCALVASGLPLLVYASRITGPLRVQPVALVRGAIVAGAGGGVAWAVSAAFGGGVGLVLGLLCGTAVFLGLALLVGFLPRADAEWLREVLGKRFSGPAGDALLALAGRRQ